MVQFLQFVLFGIFSVLEMGNTQMFNYHVNPQKKQSIILIDCFFLRKGFFILKKGGGHWLRTMTKDMKKKLAIVFVLCSSAALYSGCGKESPSPEKLNQSMATEAPADVDQKQSSNQKDTSAGETETNSDSKTETNEEKTTDDANTQNSKEKEKTSDIQNQDSAQNNECNPEATTKEIFPISEKTKTYIDQFGIQTVEKEYVIPYNADIREIAPALLNMNSVQYGIDSIVSPQNYEEKKVVKSNIALTEEEAKKFATELEYDETDGSGVLTLDPNSVKVELNKNDKIPSKTSFKKTYDMAIKDQNKIPQTVKSNGITYYQNSVTWTDMGDPGTGINGTDGNSAYGTYNTVASSWRATVTYSGTKYTEDKDYKGTATYVGKILVKNSPVNTFIVTYKPNTMVANASGIYYNNYVNSLYNKENSKLVATNPVDTMGMYSAGGYGNTLTAKILAVLLALIFLFVGSLMYVAMKVWRKVNEEPEKLVATVNEEEVPVELMGRDDPEDVDREM